MAAVFVEVDLRVVETETAGLVVESPHFPETAGTLRVESALKSIVLSEDRSMFRGTINHTAVVEQRIGVLAAETPLHSQRAIFAFFHKTSFTDIVPQNFAD